MKDPMKPRDKITQKMSRDGLTEQNQTTGESELISKRIQDADFQKTPEQQAAQDAAQLQGALSTSSPLPHAPEHFSKPQDAAACSVFCLFRSILFALYCFITFAIFILLSRCREHLSAKITDFQKRGAICLLAALESRHLSA